MDQQQPSAPIQTLLTALGYSLAALDKHVQRSDAFAAFFDNHSPGHTAAEGRPPI